MYNNQLTKPFNLISTEIEFIDENIVKNIDKNAYKPLNNLKAINEQIMCRLIIATVFNYNNKLNKSLTFKHYVFFTFCCETII